jgi:polysaccharide pyruvyl transferase WcaK-like protein
MKKVGLLSFPRYFNYGSQLQLFALKTVIQSLDYECEVIDYERRYGMVKRVMARFAAILRHPLKFLSARHSQRQSRNIQAINRDKLFLYQDFLNKFIQPGPRRYSSFHELCAAPPACDAFVCGSDQIWNPITHNDPTYFLGFVPRQKRIAYAPSIGVSSIPIEKRGLMQHYLLEMAYVSVREDTGASLIRELTGREVPVVLDPTLLLSASHWEGYISSGAAAKPYVLCYFLEADSYMREIAFRIAERNNWSVVMIPSNKVDFQPCARSVEKRYDCGPIEFLECIKGASFVCTDSFHGSVFSTIFRKPFLSFRRYENQREAALFSRITHLLNLFGLQDREMTRSTTLPDDVCVIDYSKVDARLAELRGASIEYLRSSLSATVGG